MSEPRTPTEEPPASSATVKPRSTRPVSDDFARHALRRSWFIALQAIVVLLGVTIVLAVQNDTTYTRTTHFVLHPNSSLPLEQVPQAIDALDNDGPMVQTVLRVLGSDEVLRRAAETGDVDEPGSLSLDAALQPGSAYFDATIRGDRRGDVDAATRGLVTVGSQYVSQSFAGYELEALGASTSTNHSFPPSFDLVVVSLLLGAMLGTALVYFEWHARREVAASEERIQHDAAVAQALADARVAELKPTPVRQTPRRAKTTAKTGSSPRATGTRTSKPRAAGTRTKKAAASDPSEPTAELGVTDTVFDWKADDALSIGVTSDNATSNGNGTRPADTRRVEDPDAAPGAPGEQQTVTPES